MPMNQSLWDMMDERIEQLMMQWAQATTGLATANVVVAEQYDPQPDMLPMILIRSYEATYEDAEALLGDSVYHMSGIIYPYEIVVATTQPNIQTAKSFATDAVSGVREKLRGSYNQLLALTALDGEHVNRFEFDGAEIFVRGLAGAHPEGSYMATCSITLRFYTEV
jgi:hypothetical protein